VEGQAAQAFRTQERTVCTPVPCFQTHENLSGASYAFQAGYEQLIRYTGPINARDAETLRERLTTNLEQSD
jgi:hypothetical protein